MKRMVMVVVASMTLGVAFNAEAQSPSNNATIMPTNSRPGVLSRLWELEKRKNAWIRKNVFGR